MPVRCVNYNGPVGDSPSRGAIEPIAPRLDRCEAAVVIGPDCVATDMAVELNRYAQPLKAYPFCINKSINIIS